VRIERTDQERRYRLQLAYGGTPLLFMRLSREFLLHITCGATEDGGTELEADILIDIPRKDDQFMNFVVDNDLWRSMANSIN
jgi:hypothetical protein